MRIDRYDDDRALLLPLFALADDSKAQIATYISRGELLVARDGKDPPPRRKKVQANRARPSQCAVQPARCFLGRESAVFGTKKALVFAATSGPLAELISVVIN